MLKRRVLVLNQSFEPLCISSVRRAVVLLYLDKAEVVEPLDHKYLRSVNMRFRVPSIVRLLLYKKIPHKKVVLSRKNILKRDKRQCQYCGRKNVPMTVDHVISRNRGGKVSWNNLVCACVQCNSKKGDRSPEEAGMSLIRIPRKPNHVSFLSYFADPMYEEWKPYLFIK